jgi:hypothetical protein
VVVVTDGIDFESELGAHQIEELAQREGVAIYVIGLGIAPLTRTDQGGLRIDPRRPMLNRLTENTGGRFLPALGERALIAALEEIEQDLRSQVVIIFQSNAEGTEFRPVEVKVARPGARARTMAGYWP